MDGNTRLCTATAAAALKATFGSDGQPGCYTDLDSTAAILHVGHNIAFQQTVLWARILDRLAGKNPHVVLPAAIWGEKTGCFTNVDRTVHISHQAIEPPGEARADLDVFLGIDSQ